MRWMPCFPLMIIQGLSGSRAGGEHPQELVPAPTEIDGAYTASRSRVDSVPIRRAGTVPQERRARGNDGISGGLKWLREQALNLRPCAPRRPRRYGSSCFGSGLYAWQDPVRVLMPRSDLAGREGALRPAAGKEAARLWPTPLRGGVHAGRPNPSPDHRPLRPSRQRSLQGRRKSHRKRNCGFPRIAS